MRQGRLQKEQRKQYPLRRGGGRQGGGAGLLPAASVQENRSHFWTLPHSPISSLVHLLPRVCSPRALRGVAGPSPVTGPGLGWACCPARPCSLPETQGEALTRQPRSSCSPTPHSRSWSSSPFLPHPAPRWALPCPGVPRTMDPPGPWSRLAGELGSVGERRPRRSSHPPSPLFPELVRPRRAEGVVRGVRGTGPSQMCWRNFMLN